MRTSFRRHIAPALMLALAALPAGQASAQEYPARPITLVVAFAAGGFADGVARVIGTQLSERLGQNVVIENRGGGGGNIAAAYVAKAEPDGYTVLVSTTGLAINNTLIKNRGFNVEDLRAVAVPAWAPETLSVHSKSPVKTLADLVTLAKSKPVNFASPGVGTSGHISTTYFFKNLAKVEAVHVPFKGGAPAVAAAAGGHVDALSGAVAGYAGQLRSGIVRGIAVASEKRLPQFPDMPTYAESGYPELVASTWIGVFLPAKTSNAIADKLNKAINDIVADPKALEQFAKLQTEVRRADRPESEAFMKSEIARWQKMITSAGLELQ